MTVRRDSGRLPAGYTLVRTVSGHTIAVPQDVADDMMADETQRERARQAQERARQRRKERKAAKSADVRNGTRVGVIDGPSEPKQGFYRVLPRFAEQIGEWSDEDVKIGSADHDTRERQRLLRERLVKLGPDRRVARPDNASEALDTLEAELPNFSGPVRLIRNSLAVAEATNVPVRIPPMLLLGPPGIGKTLFSHRLAQLLGAPYASIAFDQPSAGTQLRGSDKHWSNSESGLLFKLIALGDAANPVILLDELDKAASDSGRRGDPLGQLHGALEPQNARHTVDASTEIELDASLTTYIATANSIRGMQAPLLSRMEIFTVAPPSPEQSVQVASQIVSSVLERLGLRERVRFERQAIYVLAHLSPRLILRTVEKAVAAAVRDSREVITEAQVCDEIGVLTDDGPKLH